MNKKAAYAIATILALSLNAYGQEAEVKRGNGGKRTFTRPVLVRFVNGTQDTYRIGFVRENGEMKNGESNDRHEEFLDMLEVAKGGFKDKCFVYFPVSRNGGEMLICDKGSVTDLDFTYEQAIGLALQ